MKLEPVLWASKIVKDQHVPGLDQLVSVGLWASVCQNTLGAVYLFV